MTEDEQEQFRALAAEDASDEHVAQALVLLATAAPRLAVHFDDMHAPADGAPPEVVREWADAWTQRTYNWAPTGRPSWMASTPERAA